MFFPNKEEIIELEHLAKRQHQIYPDAADYGLLMSEFDNNRVRIIINELLKTYKSQDYQYKKTGWSCGKSIEWNIPLEQDGGVTYGLHVYIAYHNDKTRKIDFITIDIKNSVIPSRH
jgi:hypothetical protein